MKRKMPTAEDLGRQLAEGRRAKTDSFRPRKVYRLYLWNFSRAGAGPRLLRGQCVATFSFYKDLVADAERRAVAAGYPKSRWSDLFDWNL